MKRSLVILAAGVLALAACEKPSTPETKTDDPSSKNATTTGATPAANTDPTPATPAVTPVVVADSDLATPADFEETAEKSISKANYKSELASLQADIDKE